MNCWCSAPRTWFRWLLLIPIGWYSPKALGGTPRHRAARPLPRQERAQAAPQEKASAERDCEVWPPRRFPSVSDLYALKLEYDCRNRTIAHQRHDLANKEAQRSIALSEKRDIRGIDEKNLWAEKEQSNIESRQLELDRWREEMIKKLQLVGQDSGAGRVAEPPTVLTAAQ